MSIGAGLLKFVLGVIGFAVGVVGLGFLGEWIDRKLGGWK